MTYLRANGSTYLAYIFYSARDFTRSLFFGGRQGDGEGAGVGEVGCGVGLGVVRLARQARTLIGRSIERRSAVGDGPCGSVANVPGPRWCTHPVTTSSTSGTYS